MKRCMVVAIGLSAGVALAESVDPIGWRETGGVDVSSGEKTIDAPLRMATGATFVKTGAGTLNLPKDALERNAGSVRYHVLGGTVKLTGDDVSEGALTVPEVLSAKAAFWVSSAKTDSIVTDGAGNVVRWYDVRETGVTAAGFVPTRPYMKHACVAGRTDQQQSVTTFQGHAVVYFGGYGAKGKGGYMQLVDAAGNDKKDITSAYNVFFVHGVDTCWGTVIGHVQQPNDFMNDGSIASVPAGGVARYFHNRVDSVPGQFAGRAYRNGTLFDPFATRLLPGTFELVDVDLAGNGTGFSAFFNNRNAENRQGGDYLSEVAVFEGRLTEAERLDVERYLMRKWGLGGRSPASMTLGVARGAQVELASDSTATDAVAATNALPCVFEGEGTVSLSGTGWWTVPPRAFDAFGGSLSLGGGTLFSRFDEFPALTPETGRRYVVTERRAGGASDVRNGSTVTGVAGAAKEIAKDGSNTLAFASIPADATHLRVMAGTLSLVGRETSGRIVPATAWKGVFPNPNMEKTAYVPTGSRGRVPMTNGQTLDGWTFHASGGFTGGYVVGPVMGANAATYEWGYEIPEGKQALYFFSSNGVDGFGALTTTVRFDAPGEYLVSWCESMSSNGILLPSVYSVLFGEDYEHAVVVDRRPNVVVGFPRTYLKLTVPAAGEYCFGFRIDDNYGGWYAMLFDDVRADLVSCAARPSVVAIPNGDFEQVMTNGAPEGVVTIRRSGGVDLRADNLVRGWTFHQGEGWTADKLYATVGVASPALPQHDVLAKKPTNSNYKIYSRIADETLGSFQLFLCAHPAYPSGYAETTFTVAEPGTYRLRGKVGCWNVPHFGIDYFGDGRDGSKTYPSVRARVTVGGETVDLGVQEPTGVYLRDRVWPDRAFTVTAANTPVTLRLADENVRTACLVDDLVLVREEDLAVDESFEYIANGSFEANAGVGSGGGITIDTSHPLPGWTLGVGALPSQVISCWQGFGNGAQYTIVPYDGKTVCCVRGTASLSQVLPPLVAGRYRFRLAANSRWTAGYDENGVRVTLNDPETDEEKVVVCEIPEVTTRHAHVSSHEFELAEPGVYRLKIVGTHAELKTGDRACAIDGLSLKRLGGTKLPPSVPKELRIEVAEGARLNLDFDGRIQTRGVWYGGTFHAGMISAETHPEFVTGVGEIESVPSGTVLIFR